MNNLRIADMAHEEKPCEKMIESGTEVMSDAELLAVILRCGTRDMSAIQLSQLLLNSHPVYKGLAGLNYMSFKSLTDIPGIGKAKACQIMALTELSRRMSSNSFKSDISLDSPSSVASYFMEKTRYLTRERLYALFMASNNSVIKEKLLSTGTINSSLVSPREVFVEALECNAVNVVLIHNHPSGDPQPSTEDISISKRIKSMGNELGIKLLDHVIIGDMRYVSLKEMGLI
jgi:DNA repair protein RadC